MKDSHTAQIERTYAMAELAAWRLRRMGFVCEVERESFARFAVVNGPATLTVGTARYPRACSLLVRPVSWVVRPYEAWAIAELRYLLCMGTDQLGPLVPAIRRACEG